MRMLEFSLYSCIGDLIKQNITLLKYVTFKLLFSSNKAFKNNVY